MVEEEFNGSRVLVTGAAGFIGYHLTKRLLADGYSVAGVDNLNDYYDVNLKEDRLALLAGSPKFLFQKVDLADKEELAASFDAYRPRIVVNLAAQAGVRYSLLNPDAYVQSNLVGFANVVDLCKQHRVDHLLYASSSSVYGGNTKVPFDEEDPVDHPVSLYAATKRSNELMADSYAHLYTLPQTGLRFFTVYGPLGRPDMAYYSFANKFFRNEPIRVFNNGDSENDLSRDFTFIDDVVESVVRLIPQPPGGARPHRLLNVGGSRPEKLTDFIATLEESFSEALGKQIVFDKRYESMKPGDVPRTFANPERLRELTGYIPSTALQTGLKSFADRYVRYYQLL